MSLPTRLTAILIASASLHAVALAGPAKNEQSAEVWARSRLSAHVAPDLKWSTFQSAMSHAFRMADRDGNGISAADYESARRISDAQFRAKLMQQHLSKDLNNDGKVSRDELTEYFTSQATAPLRSIAIEVDPTPEQRKAVLDKLVGGSLEDDRNGDGAISYVEMRLAAAAKSEGRPRYDLEVWHIPMSFDRDGDGVVSREEFDSVIRAAFREADTNGDDLISADEQRTFSRQVQEMRALAEKAAAQRQLVAKTEAQAAACGFPTLPERAKLVVVGAYEGKAVSTASIGGDDREVTTSDIVVEPGSEPIYLVLVNFDANIWRLSGAIGRIVQVVATASATGRDGLPRAGVIGVDKGRVYFPPNPDCLRYFSDHPSNERQKAVAALEIYLKRTPDVVITSYGAATVGIPSGKRDEASPMPGAIAMPQGSPASGMWKEMLRFHPSGLVSIDPATVVAPLPVKRFDVLPQQAGLAQLIEDGSLKVVSQSRVLDVGGTRIIGGEGDTLIIGGDGGSRPAKSELVPGDLLIQRKIRFPAGLHGGHSVRFILGRGVTPPDGDPGHSCVVSEETGQPISGRSKGC